MREKVYIVTALSIILCLTLHVHSKTLVLKDWQKNYELDQHLLISEHLAAISTIETLLANPSNHLFLPYQDNPRKYQPQQTYWSKFQIENQLANGFSYPQWVLQLSLIFTEVEVYIVDSKGGIQVGRTGFFVPPNKRTYLPIIKANVIKMTLLPREKYTVYRLVHQ